MGDHDAVGTMAPTHDLPQQDDALARSKALAIDQAEDVANGKTATGATTDYHPGSPQGAVVNGTGTGDPYHTTRV